MPETGLFLVASALLTIAPGPDILYVLTRGVAQGRAAGIAAALGFATGCIFHTLFAALGIAALIRSSDLAFNLVRYAGAAYLAWIGVQALLHRASFSMQGASGVKGLGVIYRQSVLGNMMNPKTALFFLAFLPQFVNTAQGHAGWQIAQLGVLFTLQAALLFGTLGYFAGRVGQWLGRNPKSGLWLDRIAGSIFVGLGLRLIVSR
jgi:threonine/homoserine/homoserine lactone efflux protein